MGPDPDEDPHSVAVEQLEEFGLSTYAARTFIALVQLEAGTARDVSRVAEVPRTRVYDAAGELQDRGLVEVTGSSPREFWAVSAATAARKLERELQQRASLLTVALGELGPVSRTEQRGVWTTSGTPAVTDRVAALVADASDEVVLATGDDLLSDDVVAALRDAADRGVAVTLGGRSPAARTGLADAVPAADRLDHPPVYSNASLARLLVVDGSRALASVLVDGDRIARDGTDGTDVDGGIGGSDGGTDGSGDGAPGGATDGGAGTVTGGSDGVTGDGRTETAVWAAGETNGLVVVLRGLVESSPDDAP